MMQQEAPCVVLDCMVYLQAVVNAAGPAAKVIRAVENGQIRLFVSDEVLNEVADVLNRPELQQKFPRLTPERAESLVQFMRDQGTLLETIPNVFTYPRDPKDEKYINLALAANASYLVSRDNDLHDLMDTRHEVGRNFQAQFPTLTILDPVALLHALQVLPQQGSLPASSRDRSEER